MSGPKTLAGTRELCIQHVAGSDRAKNLRTAGKNVRPDRDGRPKNCAQPANFLSTAHVGATGPAKIGRTAAKTAGKIWAHSPLWCSITHSASGVHLVPWLGSTWPLCFPAVLCSPRRDDSSQPRFQMDTGGRLEQGRAVHSTRGNEPDSRTTGAPRVIQREGPGRFQVPLPSLFS